MDYRTLDLTNLSAKGLTIDSTSTKLNPAFYAIASISGSSTGSYQEFKTTINKSDGSDPTWNIRMSFMVNINEAAGLTLVVKIKASRMLVDKTVGKVNVSIEELVKDVTREGKSMRTVSYPIKGRSDDEPQGDLSFSYKVGEKFTK